MLSTRFDKERCSVAFSADPPFVVMTQVRKNHGWNLLCLNDDLNIFVFPNLYLDHSRPLDCLRASTKTSKRPSLHLRTSTWVRAGGLPASSNRHVKSAKRASWSLRSFRRRLLRSRKVSCSRGFATWVSNYWSCCSCSCCSACKRFSSWAKVISSARRCGSCKGLAWVWIAS